MAKQDTSAVRRCPVRPVGAYFLDNDRRSRYIIPYLFFVPDGRLFFPNVFFALLMHNN